MQLCSTVLTALGVHQSHLVALSCYKPAAASALVVITPWTTVHALHQYSGIHAMYCTKYCLLAYCPISVLVLLPGDCRRAMHMYRSLLVWASPMMVCVLPLYSISFNHLEIQNEAERVRQDLLDAKCLQV